MYVPEWSDEGNMHQNHMNKYAWAGGHDSIYIILLAWHNKPQNDNWKDNILVTYTVNTAWQKINIHSCYSQVKIDFALICTCKNN